MLPSVYSGLLLLLLPLSSDTILPFGSFFSFAFCFFKTFNILFIFFLKILNHVTICKVQMHLSFSTVVRELLHYVPTLLNFPVLIFFYLIHLAPSNLSPHTIMLTNYCDHMFLHNRCGIKFLCNMNATYLITSLHIF